MAAVFPILVLLGSCFGSAQHVSDSLPPRAWDVAVGFDGATLGMDLYQDFPTNLVRLETDISPRLGLSVRHVGMGIDFGFASGKLQKKGVIATESWDLQWFWYFQRFGFDLYLQSYEGYKVEGDSLGEDILHPDLTMSTQTFATYMKLFGNIGLDGMNHPIARKEWISCLLYGIADVSHRTMKSPSPVIPPHLRESYGSLATLERIDVIAPGLSMGLFVPEHLGPLYFNSGMSLGFGAPLGLADSDVRPTLTAKINFKFALGIEGETSGVGFSIVNDSHAEELGDSATAQFHSLKMRLYVHRRF